MQTPNHQKEYAIFRIYLGLVSIIGLIGTIVSVGTFGYTFLNTVVISNIEYVQNSPEGYAYRACSDPASYPADPKTPAKTPAQITDCQNTQSAQILLSRKYNTKTTLIDTSVWGLIFLIVFLTHYPFFLRRYSKKD